MRRYILVYEIDDFADCGGGTHVESFESEEQMHKRVNEVASNDERVTITKAGLLQKEYEYKPVEVVKEYRPELKK